MQLLLELLYLLVQRQSVISRELAKFPKIAGGKIDGVTLQDFFRQGHPTLTDFVKVFTEKPQFRGIGSRGLGLGHMARLRLFVLALYRVLVPRYYA